MLDWAFHEHTSKRDYLREAASVFCSTQEYPFSNIGMAVWLYARVLYFQEHDQSLLPYSMVWSLATLETGATRYPNYTSPMFRVAFDALCDYFGMERLPQSEITALMAADNDLEEVFNQACDLYRPFTIGAAESFTYQLLRDLANYGDKDKEESGSGGVAN